jgi:hypothetical protein
MPKARKTGTLAKLERELHAVNARRHQIIAEIASVVEQLSLGAMIQIAKIGQVTALGAELPSRTPPTVPAAPRRRKMSAEARARISASTKARWAKAKKAGKTSLG